MFYYTVGGSIGSSVVFPLFLKYMANDIPPLTVKYITNTIDIGLVTKMLFMNCSTIINAAQHNKKMPIISAYLPR